ncbi:hypothetical protein [Yersinia intermedia]|uniref:hypothetical protein n=1 Tax=Yersinia intermedia TaxID=631 RepID=UPI00065CEE49|nr:hypothetical protein [Yersinia intermedia]CRY84132.1 Uncharacterised protein [Yersinia intermedia]
MFKLSLVCLLAGSVAAGPVFASGCLDGHCNVNPEFLKEAQVHIQRVSTEISNAETVEASAAHTMSELFNKQQANEQKNININNKSPHKGPSKPISGPENDFLSPMRQFTLTQPELVYNPAFSAVISGSERLG